MKTLARLLIALAALIWVAPALAAPPVTITGPDGTQATVTGNKLDVNASFAGTVTVNALIPDSTTSTGNIVSNGDTVTLTTTGGYGSFGVTITGTWSGTIQVLGSQDCTSYAVTTALPLANGVASNVISANGSYQGNMGGLKCIQLKGLSMVSGTAAVKLSAGAGTSSVMQDNIPWITGGYSTGASATAITSTVKAASTQAAATDTSLVVQENPNSPAQAAKGQGATGAAVPAGAQYIGGNSGGNLTGVSIGSHGGVVIEGVASGTPVPISGTVTSNNASVTTNGSTAATSSTLIGVSDGTNQEQLIAPISLGDGVNGNNSIAAGLYGYNGASWDRLRVDGSKNLDVNVNTALPAGTNNIGAVSPAAATSGGLSEYVLEPAASDNHAVIKNGAGQVYTITGFNNSATINYLRLYDAGTGFNGCNSATGLVWEMHIPANSTNDAGFVLPIPVGLSFTNGISICVTGGYGQTNTTNATASAISISIGYK